MASGTSFAGFRPFYSLSIRDLPSLDLSPSSHQPADTQSVTTASDAPFLPMPIRRRRRSEVPLLPPEIESLSISDQESEFSNAARETNALRDFVISLVQAIARSPYSLHTLARGVAFVVKSLKSAVKAFCRPWLAFKRWWLPLRDTPSPNPADLALISTGRRRPLCNEPLYTAAGSQTRSSVDSLFMFAGPKSLQHARQWRDIGKPTSPSTPRLPRVNIHVKSQRNVLRGETYADFRQFFKYDAPPDTEAQLALADVYDNPVLTALTLDGELDNTDLTEGAARKIVKAPPAQQPRFVVHPLCWEGKSKENPAEAIKQAMNTLVTVLTINHCSIELSDVVAILASAPASTSAPVVKAAAPTTVASSPQDIVVGQKIRNIDSPRTSRFVLFEGEPLRFPELPLFFSPPHFGLMQSRRRPERDDFEFLLNAAGSGSISSLDSLRKAWPTDIVKARRALSVVLGNLSRSRIPDLRRGYEALNTAEAHHILVIRNSVGAVDAAFRYMDGLAEYNLGRMLEVFQERLSDFLEALKFMSTYSPVILADRSGSRRDIVGLGYALEASHLDRLLTCGTKYFEKEDGHLALREIVDSVIDCWLRAYKIQSAAQPDPEPQCLDEELRRQCAYGTP
ncbi:hypothetical protein NMY22_g13312 [Coprinellus aureogranulatus]|nr:hypothetical protein NMY22_g13312 [Coprinellus aureogranulatus]